MPTNTRSILKDQDGLPIPQAFDVEDDIYRELLSSHERGSMMVGSVKQVWRRQFLGTVLDTGVDGWEVIQTGTGHTVTLNNELRIATGTTINTETIIRSRRTFRPAARLLAVLMLSQRIANQEFNVGFETADGLNFARWQWDGTVNTTAKAQVRFGRDGASQDGTLNATGVASLTATSSFAVHEIDAFVDEIIFATKTVDSGVARVGNVTRNRTIPSPDDEYHVVIRVRNLGTAPASSTTLTIDAMAVTDIAELTTEVTAGRGGGAAGQAIPVAAVSVPTTTINAAAMGNHDRFIWWDDTQTALGAGAAFNGTSRDMAVQATGVVTAAGAGYDEFRVAARADQAGTLIIQHSRDNTNWFDVATIAVPADTTKWTTLISKVFMRYCRVRYLNGGTANTVLNVTSVQAQS